MNLSHCWAALLALSAITTGRVEGLASPTKTPLSKTTVSSVYTALQSTPVVRASDQQSVLLTDQWRAGTPLGIGDEKAVCAFLRHFG